MTLVENAAFLGYAEGRLSIAVRSILVQSWVRDALREVELGRYFPDFRQLDVRIDATAGRTGDERRTALDAARQAAAEAEAAASPLLKRLIASLDARVESVSPAVEAPRDMSAPELESEDE